MKMERGNMTAFFIASLLGFGICETKEVQK